MTSVNENTAPSPIAEFIGSVCAAVPSTVSREKINETLDALHQSFATSDIAARCRCFASDIVAEDPVGIVRAHNRDELHKFFSELAEGGLDAERQIRQRIIIGDEAVELVTLTLSIQGGASERLTDIVHYVFNSDGAIRSVRVFVDKDCVGR